MIRIFLVTPAFAFEPMPPIMQKLLEVFPEENGRFVDEPFGSIESMPKEARPLFETFRIVVPTPDDIDMNLARLFSASSHFPIKKITRYDKEPGAPGLAGFRGVWCQTEDESQVGFSIVTINQNRFLIWAKMGYYPAFANDSINPKVRDQYARDVSQYLAGIDMKVPENEAPQAAGRGLPVWMELFKFKEMLSRVGLGCGFEKEALEIAASKEGLNVWGYPGVIAVKPMWATFDSIIVDAPDTILFDERLDYLEIDLQTMIDSVPPQLRPVAFVLPKAEYTNEWPQSVAGERKFAIDRYGRIRLCASGWADKRRYAAAECLFPGAGVISVGVIRAEFPTGTEKRNAISLYVSLCPSRHFCQLVTGKSGQQELDVAADAIRLQVRSLGHLFAALKQMQLLYPNVLISWMFPRDSLVRMD